MKKLGVSKGVPEGVAVAPGGWEESHDWPEPRQPAQTAGSMGAGGGTEDAEPGREVTRALGSPRRAHASTRGRRLAGCSPPPPGRLPHYITGGWAWRRRGKSRGLGRPPPPPLRAERLRPPGCYATQARRGIGRLAALLTRAGQCG